MACFLQKIQTYGNNLRVSMNKNAKLRFYLLKLSLWHKLGNSDHVFVSVSIDFPTNSQQDAPFHHIAYDYSHADWDSPVIIWEMFHGRIFLNLVLLLLLVNFVSGFRLELMYIYHIENIRPSLIHLHGFQLLVLLP